MKTNLLSNTFEISDKPGLDTFDPRYGDITTFIQEGKLAEATPEIEAVLDEGILDIRLVGYYCFLVFNELGLTSLADIFTDLSGTLTTNWEATGPLKNKERFAQASLSWFYKMLLKRLQREESSQGPGWNLWTGTLTSDEVGMMLEAAESAQSAIAGTLEQEASAVLDYHSKVKDWLQSFQKIVYVEPAPEPEPEPEPEEEPEQEEAPVRAANASDDAVIASGSYHLKLLIRKLQAFERLIDEEKFPRAALVADDINNIIANFDPTLYFPALFANYTRLLATNIGELAEYEEMKETRDWQALQAFYMVDLDGFIEF